MLLFCYSMAQVRKYAEGNVIQNATLEPYLAETNGILYISTSALDYLEDVDSRNWFSKKYRRDSEEQNIRFNLAVDKYVEGLKSGEMRFYSDGIKRTDGSNITDVDSYTDAEVQRYLISGLKAQFIPFYNESYKEKYSLSDQRALQKVLSKFTFDNPTLDGFFTAWDALDPADDTSGLRGIANRKSAYIKAIREEANRLRTDAKYRNRFLFNGWEKNINAYQDQAAKLENHADTIERLEGFDPKDESWYTSAVLAGLSPETIKNFFNVDTAASEERKRQEEAKKAADELAQREKEAAEKEANLKKTLEFYDPLSTKDIVWWEQGTPYTINDKWESLQNENATKMAQSFLVAYNRKAIKDYWGYWNTYKGKYLENLTPLFDLVENGLRVYSVSNGPLGNVGKKFYIKRPGQPKPEEVIIKQDASGVYFAISGDKRYTLGNYNPDSFQQITDRNFDDTVDLGVPILFNKNKVFKDMYSVDNYWNTELLKINPNIYPTTVFWDMLYKLSDLYKTLGPEYSTGKKLYKGSSFIYGPNVFGWKFRGNQILFIFKGMPTYEDINGHNVISPKNLIKVLIESTRYKVGGKISYLQTGGDLIAYLNLYNLNRGLESTNYNKPSTTNEQPELPKKEDKTENPLTYGGQSEGEFTGSDAVRLGASLLDLLGSFMIFPKGLNIASAATTGAAFAGYLGADMYDVIDGRADFWPTIGNDLAMLGVMAFPMFVNPAKAKAWGAGDKLTKVAGLVSKWWGTAVTLGILGNEDTRKAIGNTIKKVFVDRKWSELDAHDFSNLAFILRSIGGTKDMIHSFKSNKTVKKAKEQAKVGEVKYTVTTKNAAGEEVKTDGVLPVTKEDSLIKKSLIERIYKEVNKDKLDENGKPKIVDDKEVEVIKPEQIEIKNKVSLGEKAKNVYNLKEADELPVKVDWKDPKKPENYVELETEPWYPNRIWQKATLNGEILSRENTGFGKWARSILGEDFDVSFSDYNITKRYRLNKIKKVSENLFGGINQLKELGKLLEDLRETAIKESWTQEKLDGALLSKMNDYGFGIPNSEKAILTKANELADYYKGTLSKMNGNDDLQFAIHLYGLDQPLEGQSEGINLLKEQITPEELQLAYNRINQLVKDNFTEPEGSITLEVMNNFNKDSVVSLYKLNAQSLAKLLKDTEAYKKWNSKQAGKIIPTDVTEAIIAEILKKYNFTPTQTLQLRRLMSKNNFISKRYRDAFNKEFFGDFKPLNVTELATIVKDMKEFKDWRKKHPRATELPTLLHNQIYNQIKNTYNYNHEDMQQIGYLLNGSKDDGRFLNLLFGADSYKLGGLLDFVGSVLKMQAGGKTYTSGILLTNPKNPQYDNWYDNYYKYAMEDILKRLKEESSKDYSLLLDPTAGDSVYNQTKLHSNFVKEYQNTYEPNNAAYVDDSITDYSWWVSNYFPELIMKSVNQARLAGRYSKNGELISNPLVDSMDDYMYTNMFAAQGVDTVPFGNVNYMTQEQLQDFNNKVLEALGDSVTFYVNEDGYIYPAASRYEAQEGSLTLALYLGLSTDATDGTGVEGEGSSGGTGTGTGTGTGAGTGAEGGDDQSKITYSDVSLGDIPSENLTWQKALYTLAMNAGNWDIRNTYKPVNYKQIPLIKPIPRVTGDSSDIIALNKAAGLALSPSGAISSDARLEAARKLAIMSDYNTKMLTANKTYRDAWNTSNAAATKVATENKANEVQTYNTNLLSEYKERKELLEYTAATKKANLTNIQKFMESMFTERELLNDYRRSAFKESETLRLLEIRQERRNRLNDFYYNSFVQELTAANADTSTVTPTNFLVDPRFRDSDLYRKYSIERNQIEQEYISSYNDLINNTYRWGGFSGGKRRYGYYMGTYAGLSDQREVDENLEKEKKKYNQKKQLGGKIYMAKQGGASVNWVKVENARMVNKNINTTIRETYRNLRSANLELQKTIRAMEPLIRLLQKRDVVKQK